MIVTFCGHREITEEAKVKEWLMEKTESLIIAGAEQFFLGGYGAFDQLAAEVVCEMKKRYPHIKSVLILPYLEKKVDMKKYDETIYPDLEAVPKRYAIIHRNRWMVEKSDVLIAYVMHEWGGAAKTLEYAKKKNKEIHKYDRVEFLREQLAKEMEHIEEEASLKRIDAICGKLEELHPVLAEFDMEKAKKEFFEKYYPLAQLIKLLK